MNHEIKAGSISREHETESEVRQSSTYSLFMKELAELFEQYCVYKTSERYTLHLDLKAEAGPIISNITLAGILAICDRNANYLFQGSLKVLLQNLKNPLSMEFSRQEYWSGQPFPSPGDFLTQESNPGLPSCRQILYHLSHLGSPENVI